MKNKDRMQFNLKNWRKLNWSLWNKEDENKASFEKILNKDKYKKKQEDLKMLKKIMRIVFCFIITFIGVVQIEQTKDFLDLAKLVVSFAFGMWVTTRIK